MAKSSLLVFISLLNLTGCSLLLSQERPSEPFVVDDGAVVLLPEDRVDELVCAAPDSVVRCEDHVAAPRGWPQQMIYCSCASLGYSAAR